LIPALSHFLLRNVARKKTPAERFDNNSAEVTAALRAADRIQVERPM
jgi:hypothetical protein